MIVFQWNDGASAVLNNSVEVRGPMTASVLGTKGMAELPRPQLGRDN
ncbi:MAG: hypothetical protein JXR86_04505 [Spirochaetales bacterium]|nr:hypothetical protein [Spirochaetales bacterium]